MTFNSGGLCVESSAKWYADGCEDTLRLDYLLTEESIVFDVGGYEGWWSEELITRLKLVPFIYIFEPVPEFAAAAVHRFLDLAKVVIMQVGLSDRNYEALLHKQAYGSSLWGDGETVSVSMYDVARIFDLLQPPQVDLLSINIEGGEYAVLQRLLASGLMPRIRDLQVQFHNLFPEGEAMREEIRSGLAQTHYERFNYPFAWEAWRRNES